ncbi:hypothetical protein [Streptomyces sp.]|uniref:hypothetical protein n=1 Tax=Streptomyces sp. TaxID=1931 RepID=UPI002F91F447
MKAGRRLRFSAVLVVVVLALTGFQTGKSSGGSGGKSRSGSGGKSSSGGGGGCSSSKKKNHDYDYDDDSGSSSGSDSYSSGGSTPTPTATATSSAPVDVVVVDCVKFAQKKRKGRPGRKADTTASVRMTSRAAVTETFRVELEFQDAGGMEWDTGSKAVTLDPGETKTFDVPMDSPSMVDRVRTCAIEGVTVQ